MKWISSLIASLTLALTPLAQAADTVTLAWDPTPSSPIAGYRLYYATNSGLSSVAAVSNVPPTQLSLAMPNVVPGIAYFYATAYLFNGIESDPSNIVLYTNKHFGPVNLRITASTNNQAAIWVNNTATNMQVQWSSNMTTWRGWAALQSLDPTAPVGSAIYLAGTSPRDALFWRAVTVPSTLSFQPASLPSGIRLIPNSPPLPIPLR